MTGSYNHKPIILIGLMGAGKTTVGRKLSKHLDLPFNDADDEVLIAAGCPIEDIFSVYGEKAFREVEKRVISRLLKDGPQVLATGGGAFMDSETRDLIKECGVSVWLRANLNDLSNRTKNHSARPLLNKVNRRDTLEKLMNERYPIYAEADITIHCKNETPAATTERVAKAISDFIAKESRT